MSDQLRLERQLTALLDDLYLGGTPHYRDEVLAATARTRQRPGWTFPERWLPMVDITTRPAFMPRVPFRLLATLTLLAVLVAAAVLVYVGTQRSLPAPFGPARNGLIVYAVGGDLHTGNPASGTSQLLLGGPSVDRKPVLSPDGTKVAFYRGTTTSGEADLALAVVGVDGSGLRVLEPSAVGYEDVIVWSPDSRFVLRNDGDFRIVRHDLDGTPPRVIAYQAYVQPDAFQPPNGDAILFEDPKIGRALWLVLADGTGATKIYEVPAAEQRDGCDFGAVRWSPDGKRIAFLRKPPGGVDQCRIYVMNADGTDARPLTTATGSWFETDLRWSPDGTQIAFDRWEFDQGSLEWRIRPLGVVSSTGGDVRSIGPTPVSDGAAFEWSPDGKTIIAVGGPATAWAPDGQAQEVRPVLIDVASGAHSDAPWVISSWPSWQRLAP